LGTIRCSARTNDGNEHFACIASNGASAGHHAECSISCWPGRTRRPGFTFWSRGPSRTCWSSNSLGTRRSRLTLLPLRTRTASKQQAQHCHGYECNSHRRPPILMPIIGSDERLGQEPAGNSHASPRSNPRSSSGKGLALAKTGPERIHPLGPKRNVGRRALSARRSTFNEGLWDLEALMLAWTRIE
jgi:hypothetical protein